MGKISVYALGLKKELGRERRKRDRQLKGKRAVVQCWFVKQHEACDVRQP